VLPLPSQITKALHQAGIQAIPSHIENFAIASAMQMQKYEGKPEFDKTFFQIK